MNHRIRIRIRSNWAAKIQPYYFICQQSHNRITRNIYYIVIVSMSLMRYNNRDDTINEIRIQKHVQVLTSDPSVCSVCLQTTWKALGGSSVCRRTGRINRRWDGTTRRNCSSTSPRKVLVLISVVLSDEAKIYSYRDRKSNLQAGDVRSDCLSVQGKIHCS